MTVRRLGLFGGTFDPPHFGHVAALRAASQTGRFDLIEVTVAGDPYLKSARSGVRPAALRLAMAEAAFGGLDLVEVSDREIRRVGPSYTIDTVRELLEAADEVDVIIGADLARQIEQWHDGVVPRPGTATVVPGGWDAYEIPMDPVDLSSSFIRGVAPTTRNLRKFIPEAVIPIYESFQG